MRYVGDIAGFEGPEKYMIELDIIYIVDIFTPGQNWQAFSPVILVKFQHQIIDTFEVVE